MAEKEAVKNKIAFSVEKDGKNVDLAVIRPSLKVQQEAQMVYSRSFAEFVKGKAIFKSALLNHIREQRIWDDAKQQEFVNISTRLIENERVVEGKVKGTTIKKAKESAIQMRRDRMALQDLLRERTMLEANTVEGQSENARFNYLVAACTIYPDTKKPYFANMDDYMSREDDPVNLLAANHFATIYYGYDPSSEKNLPENQFLLKHKLCNDKLQLVKLVGGVERLVDTDGKLVDENGRYINEAGEFVDSEGTRVDEAGNKIGDEVFPFIDDEAEAAVKKEEPVAPGPMDVFVELSKELEETK